MYLVTVHFDDKVRFECELNLKGLKLGDILYVNSNTSEATLKPKKNFNKYYINHIANKSRYINLHNGLYNTFDDVERIFNELDSFFEKNEITKELVQKAVTNSASNIRPKQMHKTNEIQSQQFKKWVRVIDRINLCERLMHPDVGRELFSHWSSLIEYHCLTCFDLLGQKEGYADFGRWIRSSDYKADRERVVVPENTDYDKVSEIYYSEYQRRYGVKNSFFNFLDNILNKDDVEILFSSIRIEKTGINNDEYQLGDELEKKKYLYALRNLYTHNLDAQGGVHHELAAARMADNWVYRKQIINQRDFNTFSVLNWPDILMFIVMTGLKRQVTQYAVI